MDELIDALQCTRHFALYQDCYERNCYANSGKGLYCNIPKLMADAADAIEHLKENVAHQQDAIERLMAQVPAWISVEERLPEAHRPVWTAIYTTDLIFVQDGETIEEAAERTQAEAEKHPRCEMGAVDEGGFWYELTFGAPMVCRPSFWMEPPKAPDLT